MDTSDYEAVIQRHIDALLSDLTPDERRIFDDAVAESRQVKQERLDEEQVLVDEVRRRAEAQRDAVGKLLRAVVEHGQLRHDA